MIIQSSNKPIVIELDTDVSSATAVSIKLMGRGGEIAHWDIDGVEIDENIISIPVTQEETAEYPAGRCAVYVKAVLENQTEFFDVMPTSVMPWEDLTIMEVSE